MSTLTYCAKQATAMAEYAADRTKAKLDAAIDAEESRDELIAARAAELTTQRMAEMAPIDVVAGLQSILEDSMAPFIAGAILREDFELVGKLAHGLIKTYIELDSEVMAHEWMERVEREVAQWEH